MAGSEDWKRLLIDRRRCHPIRRRVLPGIARESDEAPPSPHWNEATPGHPPLEDPEHAKPMVPPLKPILRAFRRSCSLQASSQTSEGKYAAGPKYIASRCPHVTLDHQCKETPELYPLISPSRQQDSTNRVTAVLNQTFTSGKNSPFVNPMPANLPMYYYKN